MNILRFSPSQRSNRFVENKLLLTSYEYRSIMSGTAYNKMVNDILIDFWKKLEIICCYTDE